MSSHLYTFVAGFLGDPTTVGLPPSNNATESKLSTILGMILVIIGALSLLAIVIAGLQFVASQGDPQKAARARNAIIYACVGLVVAGMSYLMVQFFLTRTPL